MSWFDEIDGQDPDETLDEAVDLDGPIETTPYVCWGVADDQLLLFNPDDRRLHVLNRTAATVWALADGTCDVDGLVERTATEFDEVPAVIHDDVVAVTQRLVAAELCRLVDGDRARWERPESTFPQSVAAPDVTDRNVIGPFGALDAAAYIVVSDKHLRHELERVLSSLLLPVAPATSTPVVYEIDKDELGFNVTSNGERLARGTTRPLVLRMIATDLNAKAIMSADQSLVLHASAASFDGSVAVFPGVSGSGKSTLVAQLVDRGGGYLTDEAVAIGTGDLWARAYPKALCIERGAHVRLETLEPPGESPARSETWDVDPRSIGDGVISAGGLVELLVFPTYQPHTLSPRLRRLTAVEVVHALIANAFDFSSIGQTGFAVLVRLANTVPAFDIEHGGHGHLQVVEELVRSVRLDGAADAA